MKLGRLLLKGLSRRPSRPKRGAALPRPKTTRFKPAPPKATSERTKTPKPTQRAQLPVAVQNPRPKKEPAAPQENTLLSARLVRPDEALRSRIEAFLLDQRSEHTRRAYGRDLKRFFRWLAWRNSERGPEPVGRGLLIAYKEQLLSEKLEHTTVDRHLATLRSFFRWLVDDGILDRNPAEAVRFLNPRRLSKTVAFSDDEVRKVLALQDRHTRIGSLHHAMLMVLFYCGLRRSELCALRTGNLSQERGHRILKLLGKGNTERIVVLVPAVWEAIEHYLHITRRSLSEDQPLFGAIRAQGIKLRPMDPSYVFYVVRKYARQAGVTQRVSPHSCRATAISNARDHQVPDRAIQEFAGWASPDMITRYDKRKSAVEKSAAFSIDYGDEPEES